MVSPFWPVRSLSSWEFIVVDDNVTGFANKLRQFLAVEQRDTLSGIENVRNSLLDKILAVLDHGRFTSGATMPKRMSFACFTLFR